MSPKIAEVRTLLDEIAFHASQLAHRYQGSALPLSCGSDLAHTPLSQRAGVRRRERAGYAIGAARGKPTGQARDPTSLCTAGDARKVRQAHGWSRVELGDQWRKGRTREDRPRQSSGAGALPSRCVRTSRSARIRPTAVPRRAPRRTNARRGITRTDANVFGRKGQGACLA